jgi:hypothetical protein
MKKILALFLLVCGSFAQAQQYRIADVRYDLTGRTREYVLKLAIPIDKKRVFASFAEFDGYIAQIRQELTNQRTLEAAELTYTTPYTEGESAIVPVTLHIRAVETKNLLIVPYPKFDSNSGFQLKLKLKDYNFLGLMLPLTFDLNYNYDTDRQDDGKNPNTVGFNFDYTLPFPLVVFDAEWSNNFSLDWAPMDNEFEGAFTTGLGITLPVSDELKFKLTAKQSASYDPDYRAAGDTFYYKEYAELTVPLVIGRISDVTPVYFTPNVHITYYWDEDGITHPDLQSPVAGPGYSVTTGHINWLGNFRQGYNFSFSQNFDWNVKKKQYVTPIQVEFQGFGASEYIGFSVRPYLVAFHTSTSSAVAMDGVPDDRKKENIGGRLRGILDSQTGIETTLAFVINLDIPVKIVQTDWLGWGKALFKKDMPAWFGIFNFELQIAPFVDAALIYHTGEKTIFDPRDGWYAAGLEVLVFPTRWRSMVVRGSVGVDIGRYFFDDKINMNWRETTKSKTEISIGIGLFY